MSIRKAKHSRDSNSIARKFVNQTNLDNHDLKNSKNEGKQLNKKESSSSIKAYNFPKLNKLQTINENEIPVSDVAIENLNNSHDSFIS